jgi:hypothetical protein
MVSRKKSPLLDPFFLNRLLVFMWRGASDKNCKTSAKNPKFYFIHFSELWLPQANIFLHSTEEEEEQGGVDENGKEIK